MFILITEWQLSRKSYKNLKVFEPKFGFYVTYYLTYYLIISLFLQILNKV